MLSKLTEIINNQRPIYLLIGILVFTFCLVYLRFDFYPYFADVGEYLNNAYRVANGDKPYKDFWLLFTPGEVYFPSILLKLFGKDGDIVRWGTAIAHIISIIPTFYYSRRLFNNNNSYGLVFSIIYFYSSVISLYEGPIYINLYFVFLTYTFFELTNFVLKNDDKSLIIAGIYSGIAIYFRLFEVGGAIVAFASVITLYQLIIEKKGLKQLVSPLIYYFTPILFIVIIFCIFHNDIATKMISEVVFEAPKNGTSMALPYFTNLGPINMSLSKDITLINAGELSRVLFLVFHLIDYILTWYIYILPIISIIHLFIAFKLLGRREFIVALFLFFWGGISFLKGISRCDVPHLAPAFAPLCFANLYLLFYSYKDNMKNNTYLNLYLRLLTLVSLFGFAIFLFRAIESKVKGYESKRIGNITAYAKDKESIKTNENLINFILNNTKKEDYIFVTPWNAPALYIACDRRNATYYDSMNDLMVRRDELKQQKVINDLKTKRVKYVIHDPKWGYDNKPEQQFKYACSLLQEFFDKECLVVAEFGEFKVLKYNGY